MYASIEGGGGRQLSQGEGKESLSPDRIEDSNRFTQIMSLIWGTKKSPRGGRAGRGENSQQQKSYEDTVTPSGITDVRVDSPHRHCKKKNENSFRAGQRK